MDKFLEKHNLPKLTEEEIDDLSRPISIEEVEQKVNNLLKQKYQTQLDSLVNSHLRKK